MSSAAIVHLAAVTAAAPAADAPRMGKRWSYAPSVTPTNVAWKTSAISPTASSTPAYHNSGSRSRAERRPTTCAPSDMPPRKITSTSSWAYALWPTKRPR